jgi:hypothetical protein
VHPKKYEPVIYMPPPLEHPSWQDTAARRNLASQHTQTALPGYRQQREKQKINKTRKKIYKINWYFHLPENS